MDEQELQEFSLEDIIKEFGGPSAAETAAEETVCQESVQPEETTAASMDETVDLSKVIPVEALAEKPAVSMEDTIDLSHVISMEDTVDLSEDLSMEITRVIELPAQEEGEASDVTSDTIRMDTIRFGKGETDVAEPVAEEELPMPAAEEDPFSDGWEPEYEQPIAEYAPPRPILIHPRSRLRELKSKLVAGPEKIYYKLLEKGLGKLQAAIFFSLLALVLSAIVTTMHALDMVGPSRMKLLVFGQFMAMLFAALMGSFQLLEGVEDMRKKRFSLNSLLVISFMLCCADGVMCLYELPRVADPRVPCCAAFALQMVMSLWNAYQKRNTTMGQMDTLRKASRLDGIHVVADYFEDSNGLVRGEGQVEDFMDHYDRPGKLDKIISIYALVAAGMCVVLGVVAGVLHGISAGLQVAAVTTLAAVPASFFVALSRPMAVLERRLHRLGAVLCGWRGVEELSKKSVFPVGHEDLCPTGSVKLNGVKFYGNREADEVIAYCAALCNADGGALAPVFNQLLESRNGINYEVADFRDYGNGGIGGEVNAEPVLVGTLEFLRSMGVDVPESIRVSHAVGISVDGELCGLFAIAYDRIRSSNAGIATLTGYRSLKAVLTTDDFMLTDEFIKSNFSANTKRMLFPSWEERAAMRAKKPEEGQPAAALSTSSGLASFAYCVTGAKMLRSSSRLGLLVHMIGGIVGMGVMLTLTILGALDLLTPANMFLYELVWMVPGLLLTEWTRSI